MTTIIEFPKRSPKFSDDDIDGISKQAVFDLFIAMHRQGVSTHNTKFLRDLAIIRKFIEAAVLRQNGGNSNFTRYLDTFFETF